MTVIEYDAMFNKLAKYAPHLVVTDNMKAKHFANGLKDYLFKVVSVSRTSLIHMCGMQPYVMRHRLKRDCLQGSI